MLVIITHKLIEVVHSIIISVFLSH